MLDTLKRWMRGEPEGADARALSSWAKTHGHIFKTVRNDRGGVIECTQADRRWRIEWGDPQRRYVEGSELRLREELGVSSDLQIMLISRSLAGRLESDVFDRYTEAMQTQIDHSMPEEMRWLAMFQRVAMGENKALKSRYQLQSPSTGVAQAWLDGEVSDALVRAASGILQADPAFVMLVLRGRLYLRMQALKVDVELLDAVDALFAVAAKRVKVVATVAGRSLTAAAAAHPVSEWPSTSASAWQTQAPHSDLQPSLPSDLPSEAAKALAGVDRQRTEHA